MNEQKWKDPMENDAEGGKNPHTHSHFLERFFFLYSFVVLFIIIFSLSKKK